MMPEARTPSAYVVQSRENAARLANASVVMRQTEEAVLSTVEALDISPLYNRDIVENLPEDIDTTYSVIAVWKLIGENALLMSDRWAISLPT